MGKESRNLRELEENTIRINRVKKFIEENLDQKLSLAALASIASFSPFHFQKVFKAIVKETPKQYIKRIRLESSAHHLGLKPENQLLEIAMDYGFNSLESFSRAFKNHYGVSPSGFRKLKEKNKIEVLQSRTYSEGQHHLPQSFFLPSEDKEETGSHTVEVVHLPLRKLIYLTVTLKDIDTVRDAYQRIKQWAFARGLLKPKTQFFALLQDHPAFTALAKCRFHTCIEVGHKPELSGEVNFQEIPARTYARFQIDGGIDELVKAVTWFSSHWLPESGFEILHFPALIIPQSDPISHHPHDISYQVYLSIVPK